LLQQIGLSCDGLYTVGSLLGEGKAATGGLQLDHAWIAFPQIMCRSHRLVAVPVATQGYGASLPRLLVSP